MILGGNYLDRGGKYVSSTISALLPTWWRSILLQWSETVASIIGRWGEVSGFPKYKVKTHKKSKENLSRLLGLNNNIALEIYNPSFTIWCWLMLAILVLISSLLLVAPISWHQISWWLDYPCISFYHDFQREFSRMLLFCRKTGFFLLAVFILLGHSRANTCVTSGVPPSSVGFLLMRDDNCSIFSLICRTYDTTLTLLASHDSFKMSTSRW